MADTKPRTIDQLSKAELWALYVIAFGNSPADTEFTTGPFGVGPSGATDLLLCISDDKCGLYIYASGALEADQAIEGVVQPITFNEPLVRLMLQKLNIGFTQL